MLQILHDFEINMKRGVMNFEENDLQKHLLPKPLLFTPASLNLHIQKNTHTHTRRTPKHGRLLKPMSLGCLQENLAVVTTDMEHYPF